MTIDVLYLAWNRKEFTETSFRLLLENTDWGLVNNLVVYDDGSTDGTREWLEENINVCPVPHVLRKRSKGRWRSPVEIMVDYLAGSDSDVFAKVDSDIAVPAGWLSDAATVLRKNPDLDLLGLAAGWTGVKKGLLGWQPCSHIGGVGLMRTDSFRRFPGLGGVGRQGFTQWQHANNPVRGWITPDLPVVQLDLIPDEPWRSLAAYYVSKRWAREWPPYDPENRVWWDWIPAPVAA